MLVRSLPALCLGLWVALACGCDRQESDREPEVTVLPVSVVQVHCESSYSYPVTYYGRVEPARQVELSFELAGRLDEVLVDDGGRVSQGEVIARLDMSLLEAERAVLLARRKAEEALLARLESGERDEVIAAAQAEVSRLEVELTRAEADKVRAENVYEGRAISKADFDKALFAYHSAVYALEQAKQRLEELKSGSRIEDVEAQASRVAEVQALIQQLEVRFDKSALRSPFDGICIRRLLDEGATIAAGQTVVEVYEADHLEARFSIPHQDFAIAARATHVEIGEHRQAVASARVVSRVDDVMRTVDIVMPLQAKPETEILPGQTCTLVIEKQEETACMELPVSALVSSVRGLWSCYRLRPVRDSTSTDQPGDELAAGTNDHRTNDHGNLESTSIDTEANRVRSVGSKGFQTVHEVSHPGKSRSAASEGTYVVEKVDVSVLFTDGERAVVTCSLDDSPLVISNGVHRIVPGTLVRIAREGEG